MLEFKKSLTNKIIYILFLVVCFSFLLGYFLPVGIDKVKSLNQGEFLFSTYTVLTQFGFLLFSFVISYFINKDYGDKNILFYRLIDKNILVSYTIKLAT
ncbi:putative peptide export permease protein YydJ [Macrococcoides caseolyticum]|nr:putative peptide export permease protein YydJ [Macrococcus caseolyticus]